MSVYRFLIGCSTICAGLLTVTPVQAGPRVAVVMQHDAPPLEKYAAKELAAQWKQLFDADVQIGPNAPADAIVTILLGSPATNPAVKTVLGDKWPKLTDQGHLIRTVTPEKNMVVVGGGSPVATLWAVYEFSHHFGVRSLLHGDFYPVETPKLSVDKLDIVLEPEFTLRGWRVFDHCPITYAHWTLKDQERLIKQLSKMKFNHVVIDARLSQQSHELKMPSEIDFDKDVAIEAEDIFRKVEFKIAGDTPGRAAFRGVKQFENADLPFSMNDAERPRLIRDYIRGIRETAKSHGMTVALTVNPFDSPKTQAVMTGPSALDRRRVGANCIEAALKEFPLIDEVIIGGLGSFAADFLSDNRVQQLKVAHSNLTWTAGCPNRFFVLVPQGPTRGTPDSQIPADFGIMCSSILINSFSPGSRRRVGEIGFVDVWTRVLPELGGVAPRQLQQIRDVDSDKFVAYWRSTADIDPAAYFLSRAGFQKELTFDKALDSLIPPICGEGVVDSVRQAFQMIDQASSILSTQQTPLGMFHSREMLGFSSEPLAELPEWPAKVRTLYTNAMNEMYRANSRSRGGARAITLYYAKRCEFGLHFMTCVEALQKSRKPGLSDDEITAQLEAAHEALYSAQNAFAEVARDQSDRGIIAVVNEFGYRPLKKALEER